MKSKLSRLAVVTAVLAALLTLLFVRAQFSPLRNHNETLSLLREVEHVNAEMNEAWLGLHSQLLQHYDTIEAGQQRIMYLVKQLMDGTGKIYRVGDKNIDQKIEALQKTVDDRAVVLDQLKTQHAIFQNSLNYFKLITGAGNENANRLRQIESLRTLENDVLYYVATGEKRWHNQALEKIASVENRLDAGFGIERDYLENFLAHTRLIVEQRAKMQDVLNSASVASVASLSDALQVASMDFYARESKTAERSRQLMYLVSVLLLGLIIYIMVLLSRNAVVLFREKERAQVTLSSISDGVVVTDRRGAIQFMNPVAERLLGCRTEEVQGKSVDEVFRLVDEYENQPQENCVRKCLRDGVPVESSEPTLLKATGDRSMFVQHSASPIRDHNKELLGAIMVFDDVTEARRMARELEWQATHDPLTGLVNRREFENRVNEAVITAHQDRSEHALMFMDLDKFKIVNDTVGHAAGDELLKQVVGIIRGELRASDLISRLGGDEFGALLPCCSVNVANQVASRIIDEIGKYRFNWEDRSFSIGVSIGLTTISTSTENCAAALGAADVACYAAKENGRHQVRIYQPSDEEQMRQKEGMQWVSRIAGALERDQLILFGQDVMPVQGDVGKPHQQELLLRVRNEDGTIAHPGAFMPTAQRYNLISSLDRWVIENAFKHYASKTSKGGVQAKLSINLSAACVADSQVLSYIQDQAAKYNIRPEAVCFELAESDISSNLNKSMQLIKVLRKHGFQFALDDFTGSPGSCAYLKNLQFDYVKIDGKLIREIATDEVARAMVEMINRVGHIMGAKTIAKFVENDAVFAAVKGIGIDFAQGYGIKMPVPLDEALIAQYATAQVVPLTRRGA